MKRPTMTRELARAASMDAGNRHMRAAGRARWNQDDYDACWDEFDRLWPQEMDQEYAIAYSEAGLDPRDRPMI